MSMFPKFELRMREGATGPMTGANSELLMDGKPIKGVTKITLEVAGHDMAKATIEVLGQFDFSGVLGDYEVVTKGANND